MILKKTTLLQTMMNIKNLFCSVLDRIEIVENRVNMVKKKYLKEVLSSVMNENKCWRGSENNTKLAIVARKKTLREHPKKKFKNSYLVVKKNTYWKTVNLIKTFFRFFKRERVKF